MFLVGIYETKVIIAVVLDISLFLAYSYSYVSFLMRLIEIIKTSIFLFILLHLYGVAITRPAEGCTPLLGPQLLLPVLWTALKLKIDEKTKRCCYLFCSYSTLLTTVNLLHAMMTEWLNKTIQTTLCRWLTCKRQQTSPITIGNRYQSNAQLYFFIDFYRLESEIDIHLRLLSIDIDYRFIDWQRLDWRHQWISTTSNGKAHVQHHLITNISLLQLLRKDSLNALLCFPRYGYG